MSAPAGTLRPYHWWDNARCAGHPEPRLWFSEGKRDRERALGYCRDCPVRQECADSRDGARGVWGGRVYP